MFTTSTCTCPSVHWYVLMSIDVVTMPTDLSPSINHHRNTQTRTRHVHRSSRSRPRRPARGCGRARRRGPRSRGTGWGCVHVCMVGQHDTCHVHRPPHHLDSLSNLESIHLFLNHKVTRRTGCPRAARGARRSRPRRPRDCWCAPPGVCVCVLFVRD